MNQRLAAWLVALLVAAALALAVAIWVLARGDDVLGLALTAFGWIGLVTLTRLLRLAERGAR